MLARSMLLPQLECCGDISLKSVLLEYSFLGCDFTGRGAVLYHFLSLLRARISPFGGQFSSVQGLSRNFLYHFLSLEYLPLGAVFFCTRIVEEFLNVLFCFVLCYFIC